jgi:hypothetical protein
MKRALLFSSENRRLRAVMTVTDRKAASILVLTEADRSLSIHSFYGRSAKKGNSANPITKIESI